MIRELWFTVKTTKNFPVIPYLFLAPEKHSKIFFYNAPPMVLNYNIYRYIRNILANGWTIKKQGELLNFTKGKMEVLGDSELAIALNESLETQYYTDVKNKVVLDVGGYYGETMIFFWISGAKKIIVYEPVEKFFKFIHLNATQSNINAELHEEGISLNDEIKKIHYETLDTSFGLKNSGSLTMEIKTKNISQVLQESNADVAKFDCEGCETSLLKVDGKILRQIPYYMIECHDNEKKIIDRFLNEGFAIEKRISIMGNVSIIHFRLA